MKFPISAKVNKNTMVSPSEHKKAKEVADNNFKKDYEFVKAHSIKSPVSAVEHRYATEYSENFNYGQKRLDLLQSKAHNFGHTGEQVKGHLRMSGKQGSHQIGKRSKAKAR